MALGGWATPEQGDARDATEYHLLPAEVKAPFRFYRERFSQAGTWQLLSRGGAFPARGSYPIVDCEALGGAAYEGDPPRWRAVTKACMEGAGVGDTLLHRGNEGYLQRFSAFGIRQELRTRAWFFPCGRCPYCDRTDILILRGGKTGVDARHFVTAVLLWPAAAVLCCGCAVL